MKILIFGAGVIGITYGSELAKAGNEVTLFVRPGRAQKIQNNGILVDILDMRGLMGKSISEKFSPRIVEDIQPADDYDLIIVSVNSNQVTGVLPYLKERAEKFDIMFLSNNWNGVDEIERTLGKGKAFFGYPFKCGGGRNETGVQTVIFGTPFTDTVLGEVDGTRSNRLLNIYRELKKAGMNPTTSSNIRGYLMSHFIWAAANVAAYRKAGNYEYFSTNTKLISDMYLAMREGFEICRVRGVDPAKLSPTCYYYLPLWMLIPFTRWLYGQPSLRRMFEGHVLHSPEEMDDMISVVLKSAHELSVPVPVFEELGKSNS
jgi:2-dehydropantoate 2-reductase